MNNNGDNVLRIAGALLEQVDSAALPPAVTARLAGSKGGQEISDPTSWRTLADIDDTPPKPLMLGMLEPESQTMIYGPGGVGKGTTSAWLISEAQREGLKVLLYDAEGRPKEWARRLSGLGADRSQVVYVEQKDLPAALLGKPLWEIIPYLGRVAHHSGCGLLLIDSIIAAMGVGEERLKSDAQAPYLFSRALDAINIPTVAVGHTPKGSPEGDPYGSVAWVNAMRLTWLGTAAEGTGHRVRWRPRKRNERGHIAAFLLTFKYDEVGRLTSVTRQDDEMITRQWLRGILAAGPRTLDELSDELLETSEELATEDARKRTKQRIGRTLRRMQSDHEVLKPAKRGGPWTLC